MKNEIKIQPNNQKISVDGNKVIKNKKIINKSTYDHSNIEKYTWNDALSQNIFPKSGITLKNIKGLFIDKLGITPLMVYVEKRPNKMSSFYVKANYHGEDLLYSRRETDSTAAGQTLLYSKRAKAQCSGWGTNPNITKDQILDIMKIPHDLAEIMIFPNNKTTMDKFENNNQPETAPVIAPPKPDTKPIPKRRRIGNPDADPKPKAKLEEAGKDPIIDKIIQRFQNIKHAKAA